MDGFGDSEVACKALESRQMFHWIGIKCRPGPSIGFGIPCGGGMAGWYQFLGLCVCC